MLKEVLSIGIFYAPDTERDGWAAPLIDRFRRGPMITSHDDAHGDAALFRRGLAGAGENSSR